MTRESPPDRPESEHMRRKKEAKRDAILQAALQEFTEHGFARARLAAVARRAGVAKGTLYLYFRGKEELFEGVLRATLLPTARPPPGGGAPSLETFCRSLLASVAELQRSGRTGLAMVVLTEGHQFPRLAEIYIDAVVEPILAEVRDLPGEAPRLAAIRRFPQLLVAPVIAGLLWNRFMTGRPAVDLVEIARAQLSLVAEEEG